MPERFAELEAIARGVQAKHDRLLRFSENVVAETARIARELDIPESDIQKWLAARKVSRAPGNGNLSSLLARLQRNRGVQRLSG